VAGSGDTSAGADPAGLVLGFANTHDHLGRLPDKFSDTAGLRGWLTGQHSAAGADGAVDVTPADVIEAREIRDALVTILVAHGDADGTSEDDLAGAEQALRRAARRYPLEASITRTGARLATAQPGLAGVLGSVLAAVVELSQSGAWDRVKACRNCHHGFVDQSRNWSASFCRTQCKSQAGMRAYRSRQRHSADS
jgi:predicted RNA-binding Zn ribbon-like protein